MLSKLSKTKWYLVTAKERLRYGLGDTVRPNSCYLPLPQMSLTINNLIQHIETDKESDNSIYGPLASGITNQCQLASGPNGQITQLPGNIVNQHLGGHLYAFTKEFYHKWKQPNGDLFIKDQPHNGGDGKWG